MKTADYVDHIHNIEADYLFDNFDDFCSIDLRKLRHTPSELKKQNKKELNINLLELFDQLGCVSTHESTPHAQDNYDFLMNPIQKHFDDKKSLFEISSMSGKNFEDTEPDGLSMLAFVDPIIESYKSDGTINIIKKTNSIISQAVIPRENFDIKSRLVYPIYKNINNVGFGQSD